MTLATRNELSLMPWDDLADYAEAFIAAYRSLDIATEDVDFLATMLFAKRDVQAEVYRRVGLAPELN